MNNGEEPHPTGGTHWLQFLPDHVYCFLPSLDADKGEVRVFEHPPKFLDDFLYSEEIKVVLLYYHYFLFQNFLSDSDHHILFRQCIQHAKQS
jgi:hypothetical protein